MPSAGPLPAMFAALTPNLENLIEVESRSGKFILPIICLWNKTSQNIASCIRSYFNITASHLNKIVSHWTACKNKVR